MREERLVEERRSDGKEKWDSLDVDLVNRGVLSHSYASRFRGRSSTVLRVQREGIKERKEQWRIRERQIVVVIIIIIIIMIIIIMMMIIIIIISIIIIIISCYSPK